MTDEPTIGELVRSISGLERTLLAAVQDIRREIAEMERTYVRRDVYTADWRAIDLTRAAHEEHVARLSEMIEQVQRQLRSALRLAISGLVFPILTSIIAFVIYAGISHGLP